MSTWPSYPRGFPGLVRPPSAGPPPTFDLDRAIREIRESVNSLSRWYVLCHPDHRDHIRAACAQWSDTDLAVIGSHAVPPGTIYHFRDPRQVAGTCPNTPPCWHSDLLHDVEDREGSSPRCCVSDCACGAPS